MTYLYKSTLEITYLSFFQLLEPEGLLCEVDFIHTLVSGETRRQEQGSGWDRSSRDKRLSSLLSFLRLSTLRMGGHHNNGGHMTSMGMASRQWGWHHINRGRITSTGDGITSIGWHHINGAHITSMGGTTSMVMASCQGCHH